jgi:hypothetical protein
VFGAKLPITLFRFLLFSIMGKNSFERFYGSLKLPLERMFRFISSIVSLVFTNTPHIVAK